jgi:integrase
MTNKKKLKVHQGKERIYSAIPSAPNISRILVWNSEKQEYLPPTRGKTFFARKYEYKAGKKVRETSYFDSLEAARAWQQGIHINVEEFGAKIVGKSILLHEVIERWRSEEWPHLKENTRIQYEKCLKFYDSILGIPIEDIKPFVLDNLISEWRKDLKKYKSVRTSFTRELYTLTYIFNWYQANYDEASLAMPFKDRHFKRVKIRESTQSARKFMTEEESESFLRQIKKEGFVFYVLALTQMRQMMRVSEVCAMKWKHLNVKDRSYTLCDHMIWPRIGGAVPYIGSGTKNVKGGEGFELNLFREVVEALNQIPKHPGCELIFHLNGEMLTYRQVQYRFDKAFARAGLAFRSTHVLRHSGATSFYNSSGDLLALQQMGTWSNSRMPQHYAKVMSTKAKDAIERIERRSRLRIVGEEEN